MEEFGAPPSATHQRPRVNNPPGIALAEKWIADHPNSATVRLRDGEWTHLLSYRVCHSPRFEPSATAMPSEFSGSYTRKVLSDGAPVIPPWRFVGDQAREQVPASPRM